MNTSHVLSIQSSVVYGFVGNRCANPIFFLNKIPSDFIDTVQLSAPSDYPAHAGTKMTGDQFDVIAHGLEEDNLLNHSHILTGYIGQPSLLQRISALISKLRREQKQMYYICDPVMGDMNRFYVSKELVDIYKNDAIKYADVLLPNIFEFEALSGVAIRKKSDVWEGFTKFHDDYGISIVILKSLCVNCEDIRIGSSLYDVKEDQSFTKSEGSEGFSDFNKNTKMNNIQSKQFDSQQQIVTISHQPRRAIASLSQTQASSTQSTNNMILFGSIILNNTDQDKQGEVKDKLKVNPLRFSIRFPYFDRVFGGTGDVFAALFTSHLIRLQQQDQCSLQPNRKNWRPSYIQVKSACEISLTAIHSILKLTNERKSWEICLMDDQDALKGTNVIFHAVDELE